MATARPTGNLLEILERHSKDIRRLKARLRGGDLGGGVEDHGALTGLLDDDHTQYLLADGTRDVTGQFTVESDGEGLQIKAGSSGDHVYLAWYADSAAQGTRSAWMGFGSAGSEKLQLSNELGTEIQIRNKVLFSDGPLVTGAGSFTQEPWSSSTIELGNYGSVGTQGSYRTTLAWNWERGTDSGYYNKGVNGFTEMGTIEIGDSGIIFQFEDNGNPTSPPNNIATFGLGQATFETDVQVNGELHLSLGDNEWEFESENIGGFDTLNLRTTNNPNDGEPIFQVQSSGNAVRLRVDHSGLISGGDATGEPGMSNNGGSKFTWRGDENTYMDRVEADSIRFVVGGSEAFRIDPAGHLNGADKIVYDWDEYRANDGSETDAAFTFNADQDTGMYRQATNHLGLTVGGIEAIVITDDAIHFNKHGEYGTGSRMNIHEFFADIGNHETLRANRGGGGAYDTTEIGYYSSSAVDPETGRILKTDITKARDAAAAETEPVGPPSFDLSWIDRVDPNFYQRTQTVEALASIDGKGGWEFGFVLEDLAEVSPYLTTKPGERVGYSPDQFAIMAVLWEGVRDLRARVKELEAQL